MTIKLGLALPALLFGMSRVFASDSGGSFAADEWRSYVEQMAPLGENMTALMADPEDRNLREEVYRALMAGASCGFIGLSLGDPEHPDFFPWLSNAYNFWALSPDGVYYLAPIDGDGVYEISGYRGTVHMSDIQVSGGGIVPPHGTGHLGPTFANYDIAKLKADKDGAFEAILSAERPVGYEGNWLPLDRHATNILIRQFAYDWLHEVDGRFAIQRLDRPAIKPRPNADQIHKQLRMVSSWAEAMVRIGLKRTKMYEDKGLVNKLIVNELKGVGGIDGQEYIEGLFDLKPDEALIYETDVPTHCRYWNIQLTDMMWSAIDYVNRQSHLNGYMAKIDRDGKFRAVISASDPGAPNWLDTAGYNKGAVLGRWTECSSFPVPTITKVSLAEIRQYLPADTPTVTAEQRDAAIRLRRKGAQLRRRW